MEASRVNAVAGPGGGLAPFLMAIAAWLGAMGAFLVLPALWRSDDRRWWRAVLLAFAGAACVAVAGSLLMAVGMRFLVGVEAARMPELLGFAVLAALAFTAIVQALVARFGSRGWLVALLFLVVQIAASGVSRWARPPRRGRSPRCTRSCRSPARSTPSGAPSPAAASSPAADAVVLVAWLVMALLVTLATAAGASQRDEEAEPAPA